MNNPKKLNMYLKKINVIIISVLILISCSNSKNENLDKTDKIQINSEKDKNIIQEVGKNNIQVNKNEVGKQNSNIKQTLEITKTNLNEKQKNKNKNLNNQNPNFIYQVPNNLNNQFGKFNAGYNNCPFRNSNSNQNIGNIPSNITNQKLLNNVNNKQNQIVNNASNQEVIKKINVQKNNNDSGKSIPNQNQTENNISDQDQVPNEEVGNNTLPINVLDQDQLQNEGINNNNISDQDQLQNEEINNNTNEDNNQLSNNEPNSSNHVNQIDGGEQNQNKSPKKGKKIRTNYNNDEYIYPNRLVKAVKKIINNLIEDEILREELPTEKLTFLKALLNVACIGTYHAASSLSSLIVFLNEMEKSPKKGRFTNKLKYVQKYTIWSDNNDKIKEDFEKKYKKIMGSLNKKNKLSNAAITKQSKKAEIKVKSDRNTLVQEFKIPKKIKEKELLKQHKRISNTASQIIIRDYLLKKLFIENKQLDREYEEVKSLIKQVINYRKKGFKKRIKSLNIKNIKKRKSPKTKNFEKRLNNRIKILKTIMKFK